MTDSDVRVNSKPVPGYFCEVTDGQPDGRALVVSVDRVTTSGRRVQAAVLAQTLSNRGYPQVKVYDHAGVRQTKPVHQLQAMAFEPDGIPPGMQVRHWNDVSTDNRWAPGGEANCGPGKPGNVIVGTEKQNRADGMRNSPAAPKPPPKLCEPHGNPVTRGSATRCHDCVAEIGLQGARLLRLGLSKEEAAAELGYPAPDGLVKLAVKYGGLNVPAAAFLYGYDDPKMRFIEAAERRKRGKPRMVPPSRPVTFTDPAAEQMIKVHRPWSHRVMTTVRGWFGRGDSQ